MRERMIEIIQKSVDGCARYWAEVVADGLIQEGAALPLCKAGDTVYQTDGIRIYKEKISEILFFENKLIYRTMCVDFDSTAIGNSIFLTKEEAEQALAKEKGGENNA